MRKAAVIVVAAMGVSLGAMAQRGGCYLAEKNTQAFLKTKTIVILSNDKKYNETIVNAFKEYWKLTPFSVAAPSDLPQYISNPEYSVVIPVVDDNTTVIAVLKGGKGKKGISNYNSESMVAYAEVDGLAFEPSVRDAVYRLPHMVKSLDHYIREVSKDHINVSSCELLRLFTSKFYNRRSDEIKGKMLLIDNRYELKVNIDEVYPYGYRIVDKSEIEAAIANKKQGTCYLASNYVFDAKTGDVLHMWFESPPTKKLTKSFFKELTGNMNK